MLSKVFDLNPFLREDIFPVVTCKTSTVFWFGLLALLFKHCLVVFQVRTWSTCLLSD